MTYWLSHVKKITKLAHPCLRKVRITYTILCILFPSENLGSQLTYMSILGAIIFQHGASTKWYSHPEAGVRKVNKPKLFKTIETGILSITFPP